MSFLGNMGTQSSSGRQTLDDEPEAAQEDMKHSVCTPSAPGSLCLLLMMTVTGRANNKHVRKCRLNKEMKQNISSCHIVKCRAIDEGRE